MKTGLVNIDHKKASIYNLGGADEGKINEVIAENGNRVHFFKQIEKQISNFNQIVLVGHGKGSANESHNFKVYIEKKNKSLFSKIIEELVTDNHETEKQLLARVDKTLGLKHIGNHNG